MSVYVFVLMLTNKTDDGGKCYLHLQFQVKKYQPSLFQYIFKQIVKVSFKTTVNNLKHCKFKCNPTHSSEDFCVGIVF